MKDKKKLRKSKALKAKRIDENASVSSALESQADGNEYFEKEIHQKLKNRDAEFEDDDVDFMGAQQQSESEPSEDEPEQQSGEEGADEILDQKLAKVLRSLESKSGKFERFYRTYKMLLNFYFSSKKNGAGVSRDHPVMKYLLECQQLLPTIECNEKAMAAARTINDKKEDKTKKIAKANQAEDPKSEVRLITPDMMKNRGIPKRKSAKKKSLTPKMRQKKRFQKAEHKMRSRGRRDRDYDGTYEGERKGIKMSINRTVNL